MAALAGGRKRRGARRCERKTRRIVAVRDYRYSTDGLVIRDDDGDLHRYCRHAWKNIDASSDEAGYRQHVFVAVVIRDARDARIDRSFGRGAVTREMRVHLARVVMGCLVVVQMDVCHRSGDGAHLNGDGQDRCEATAQHKRIL
jgi:hypothetical protein